MSKILTITNPSSGDASCVFSEPLVIPDDEEYELALHNAQLYYSWANISSSYGNDTIYYNTGAGPNKVILFPEGTYSVNDIINRIHDVMKTNGDYTVVSGVDTFDINFIVNYATIQVTIKLTNGYRLDLSNSTFGQLIGFEPINVITTTISTLTPDINRGIVAVYLTCNIIRESYSNGIKGSVVYSFVPSVPPGANISIIPSNLIFLPIDTRMINRIDLKLVDNLGRSINTRGEGSSYLLQIRKVRK